MRNHPVFCSGLSKASRLSSDSSGSAGGLTSLCPPRRRASTPERPPARHRTAPPHHRARLRHRVARTRPQLPPSPRRWRAQAGRVLLVTDSDKSPCELAAAAHRDIAGCRATTSRLGQDARTGTVFRAVRHGWQGRGGDEAVVGWTGGSVPGPVVATRGMPIAPRVLSFRV